MPPPGGRPHPGHIAYAPLPPGYMNAGQLPAPPGRMVPAHMMSGLPPPGGPPSKPVIMMPSAPGGPPVNGVYMEPTKYRPPPQPQVQPQMQQQMPPPQPAADPGAGGKIGTHIPLAKCRVLYIGTLVPTETSEGIKAVQEPLRKRYVTDGASASSVPGVDAWLTVFSSGILLQYITEDVKGNNFVTWLPIHTLHVAAAVKCIPQMRANGERYCDFVALDTPAAKQSDHPPVFSVIMRRTKGVKVLECHSFICKSNQAAMAMVESVTHAYEHKEGWMEDEPPKTLQVIESTLDTSDANARPSVPLFQPSGDKFSDRPNSKSNGYFMLLEGNHKLIKSFNVQHPNLVGPRRGPPPFQQQQHQQPHPPPQIPLEPQPAGMFVPAPSQYLADFGAFQSMPIVEFPGFVPPEKYKATMRERRRREPAPSRRPPIRRERDYMSYDRAVKVNTMPPPRTQQEKIYPHLPPTLPLPRSARTRMEDPYMAPTKYDYQDDLGNQYYSGDKRGDSRDDYSYRDNFPAFPDDLAYIAMPPGGDTSDYARFIVPHDDRRAPNDDRRAPNDDRRQRPRADDIWDRRMDDMDDRRYQGRDRRLDDRQNGYGDPRNGYDNRQNGYADREPRRANGYDDRRGGYDDRRNGFDDFGAAGYYP